MPRNRAAFDDQAVAFDRRAGLPDELAPAIAEAVLDVTGVGSDDLLLEMGIGTGQIGEHFVGRVRYRGVDTSAEMLDKFRSRVPEVDLVHGDAEDEWPAADGEASVVFGSRVFHLFAPAVLLSEARRVGGPDGATIVEGKVHRADHSPREWLRWELHRLMKSAGAGAYDPRWAVEKAFAAETDIETFRVPVVEWEEAWIPAQHIRDWEGKRRLAGVRCTPEVKAAVLAEIRRTAGERFGDLEEPQACPEVYTLVGVRW